MVSELTQQKIDEKVRLILKSAYERAKNIVTSYRETHEKIAEILLKKEEMLATEFDAFFDGMNTPEKAVF